jgi:hypothetical protein
MAFEGRRKAYYCGPHTPERDRPMANYTKRDQRAARIADAIGEDANVRDAPTLFRCAVCGVEMSPDVTIMAVSEALGTRFYCVDHVPEKWR